ncbi:hypothetical protein P3T36_004348 [Kitasatospora sp. MAP12-15]|uniref:hypothetical protein n=1 Tax=unclassified Kitasatospora TaxID=2633591 RepID=UPI0024735558|nr:hypothetical protein [Kitasatospora sp. MAP12-44]MDH6108187.1 hypothetical protein [Kitasatospora sp. MAP12-44]
MTDMSDGPRLHLSDFRVALGGIVALDDLRDADVMANRDALRESGATGATVYEGHSVMLAAELMRSMTHRSKDISGIVYATEDVQNTSASVVLNTLLHSSGHERTPGFIVTGNGCANLGFAVLSAGGPCRRTGPVLVVTADTAEPDSRVQTDSMSILGDAAGLCTVTPGPPPGPSFELVALCTTTRVASPDPRPGLAALRSTVDGVGAATRAALSAAGWTASEVTGMLVGSYSTGTRRFLAHGSGISRQIVPAIEAGHCFSVDVIRGLADLVDKEALPDGAPLLALSSGRTSWSVFALRYRAR